MRHPISFTPGSVRHRRRLALAAGLAVGAFLLGALPSLASAGSVHGKLTSAAQARKAAKQDPNRGTLSAPARRAINHGYLVPNQARYDRQKARLARRAEAREALAGPVSGPLAPSVISGKSWQGINDNNSSPPDETSAVGTTRYIELINSRFAIYNKTSNSPISTGSINSMVGAPSSDSVFDVQVIWDSQTRRFFYAADDVVSATNNRLAYGFSKTASPSGPADWCKYFITFGSTFPDYPKLGDSQFFGIIGANLYNSSDTFIGAYLAAIEKPPSGSSCPPASSLAFGSQSPLMINASTPAFTPVAANEIDVRGTGYAVSRALSLPANRLGQFQVTRNSSGNPVIPATGTSVIVPSYTVPPNAPQSGSVNQLDTLDTRPTQAVAAVDPAQDSKFAIWTQHTVNVGGRAAVRWYEIATATHSLLQSGAASSTSRFLFNGAISPNRRVLGTTKVGGNAMVLNYDSSSSTTFPGIRMVSKIGPGAQSAAVVVHNSPGPLSGFGCNSTTQTCRWGDYAAATPDPSTSNRIWQVSQFAVGSGSGTSGPATARTWNFVAKP